MPERIIEIIVYTLRRFQDDRKSKDYIDLTSELIAKGYTDEEINLSFSWIFNHLKNTVFDGPYYEDLDFLDGFETDDDLNPILTDEAYGYLLQMIQLGILNEFQVEQVLEKALTSGKDNINTEQVKSYVVNILFDSDKSNSAYSSFYFNRGTELLH
jgi:uncharacterized protein Smg (DUF494 family)